MVFAKHFGESTLARFGAEIDGILGYMGCFWSENRWDTWDAFGTKTDGILGYMGYSGISAAKIDGILGYMGCFEVLGAKIDGMLGYME